jgi:hypothetical protein
MKVAYFETHCTYICKTFLWETKCMIVSGWKTLSLSFSLFLFPSLDPFGTYTLEKFLVKIRLKSMENIFRQKLTFRKSLSERIRGKWLAVKNKRERERQLFIFYLQKIVNNLPRLLTLAKG